MKERVVTTVQIRHHQIKHMPQLARLRVTANTPMTSRREPIEAPRGLMLALAASAVVWAGVIAAISL